MAIGINGMGRIGRLTLRAAMSGVLRDSSDPRLDTGLDIVHVNELSGDISTTAHLLEFDSVQGRWKTDIEIEDQLPLDVLQLWDCFDYNLTIIRKPILSRCEFFAKDRQFYKGVYMFTIDNCHSEHSTLDINYSEHDPEHKSFNVIQLDNGQFAAQPNNRIIWHDSSLTADVLKQPDFKVCTQNYSVETESKWKIGHTDEWQYKSLKEESM